MSIQGKGKYIGGKRIELEQDLNLPPNTDIFFIVEEINLFEKNEEAPSSQEHPLLEIAKLAKPAGRNDLSVRYHEVLGGLVE